MLRKLDPLGGIYAVMKEISKKGLLNLDCMTATGKTVGENIQNAVNRNPEVIRPVENPYREAPEKRPSVISATQEPSPMPAIAEVGLSISRMPGIAHEAGVELNVDIANEISAKTPNLCHLAPAGPTYMEDLKRLVLCPFTCPASIGPPETKTVGMFKRAAAIRRPGTFLSQFGTITSASNACAIAI